MMIPFLMLFGRETRQTWQSIAIHDWILFMSIVIFSPLLCCSLSWIIERSTYQLVTQFRRTSHLLFCSNRPKGKMRLNNTMIPKCSRGNEIVGHKFNWLLRRATQPWQRFSFFLFFDAKDSWYFILLLWGGKMSCVNNFVFHIFSTSLLIIPSCEIIRCDFQHFNLSSVPVRRERRLNKKL